MCQSASESLVIIWSHRHSVSNLVDSVVFCVCGYSVKWKYLFASAVWSVLSNDIYEQPNNQYRPIDCKLGIVWEWVTVGRSFVILEKSSVAIMMASIKVVDFFMTQTESFRPQLAAFQTFVNVFVNIVSDQPRTDICTK